MLRICIKGVAHTVFNVFHFLSYFYCIQSCQVFFLKISQFKNSIQQSKKFPYNQHNLNWQNKKMKAPKKYLKKVVDKMECAVVHFGGRGLSPGGHEAVRFMQKRKR